MNVNCGQLNPKKGCGLLNWAFEVAYYYDWELTPPNIPEISRVYVYSGLPSGEFASFQCISEEPRKSRSDVMTISC